MDKSGKNRRIDAEINEKKIIDAYMKHIGENSTVPNARELSELTGIPQSTIYHHLPNIDIEDVYPAFKAKSIEILGSLSTAAKDGNVQAIKLWFEIVEKWSQTVKVDQTNTIDVSSLPDSILKAIIDNENKPK